MTSPVPDAGVTPSLNGGHVALLPFRIEDVTDRYISWLNDEEVMRYTEARGVRHTHADALSYVEKQIRSHDVHFWRIAVDGEHIGNFRVSNLTSPHRRASLALIIGDGRHRGKGVGTAAIRLASEYLLNQRRLHKLIAGIYAANRASIRAFENAGFHREAVLADHYWCDGRFVDGLMMACLHAGARLA
ncbi:MAG: GNAT family N-acetyltransferase [Alphaproteobacteria bacterium]